MDQRFYHTSQFAQKASVSVRTLRYYDKARLLSPSGHTEAGYRLYTDTDLLCLQQILALKFLGFSLQEIKQCLQTEPTRLQERLALQKAMMQEKRAQLDTIIEAIAETEELLQTNAQDWESIVRVIEVIQMQQTNDWWKKYFTEEQLKQMEALSKKYYTEEQRNKLAEWGKDFTEQDQLVANQQWSGVLMKLKRLVAADQDPGSAEAQVLAKQWHDLIHRFTHGDAGIEQSLSNMYAGSVETSPFPRQFSPEEGAFIEKAVTLYRQNQEQK